MLIKLLLLTYMFIASIYDIKTRKVNIVATSIIFVVLVTLKLFLSSASITDSILGFVILFLSYFFIALFFDGGGGDVLIMAMVGFTFGLNTSCVIVIITSFIYGLGIIIYSFVKKQKLNSVKLPYVPFAFTGTLLTFLITQLN